MNALKSMRESRGLSQQQLAIKAHVDVRQIQHYEQCFRNINNAKCVTVLRIAEALDCDVYEILNPRDD